MDALVLQFSPSRIEMIKDLYNKLFMSQNNDRVAVSLVIEHFFARGHPEFKKGYRPDYDISGEFQEAIKSFLMSYQGSNSALDLLGFVRFLEFYCFLLDEDSFYYFVENAFKFKLI